MTREEQIRIYAEEKCILYDEIGFDDEAYSLIVETAEYADRTMIDKAYKWLKENMSRYVSRDDPDKFPYGFPTREFRIDVNFERDFKKAMAE